MFRVVSADLDDLKHEDHWATKLHPTICALNWLKVGYSHALDSTNEENVKLLDAMHEGVLILDKKNQSVLFCNQPVKKLISNFVGNTKEKVLEHKSFVPVQIANFDVSKKYKDLLDKT